jgi:hypothetical protein
MIENDLQQNEVIHSVIIYDLNFENKLLINDKIKKFYEE